MSQSTPEEAKTKKDWPTKILVILTFFEIFVYLIFYTTYYFADSDSYIPGTYYRTSINFYISALLYEFTAAIALHLFIGKLILSLKNIYSKSYTKTSIFSLLVTLTAPSIISFFATYFYLVIHNSISDKSGRDIVVFEEKILFLAPALFLVAAILFYIFKKRDDIHVRLKSKQQNKLPWIFSITSAALVLAVIWLVNITGDNLKKAHLYELKVVAKEEGIKKGIEELGGRRENIQKIDIIPSKIIMHDSFRATLEWDAFSHLVDTGKRLLVLYSDEGMNYSNSYGDQIFHHSSSSCAVQKRFNGNYFCTVNYYSSIYDGGNKKNYLFFIDNSIPGNANDRDAKRKSDLLNIQAEFNEYFQSNGSYPGGAYPYKDPLPDKEYVVASKPPFNTFSPTPTFMVIAELELVKSSTSIFEFFCVDSKGSQVVTRTRPDATVYPYSCSNLFPEDYYNQ